MVIVLTLRAPGHAGGGCGAKGESILQRQKALKLR
jgi:hypothetical protein